MKPKNVKTRFKAMISVYRNITPGVNFRVQDWKEGCMAVRVEMYSSYYTVSHRQDCSRL